MKKPYIKKSDQIGGIAVWIVNGGYVRKSMDEEFTNFGQHFRFRFIPRNEFWIDKEYGPGEEQFFIDHLLIEHRLMAAGMDYDSALEKADAVERQERRRSEMIRLVSSMDSGRIIQAVHKIPLKKYSAKVGVWIVRGDLVRSLFFIDFTEGGHDWVYHFVPKNEVWLDDDLAPGDRKFVLLHELHERHLMTLGWPYGKAHRSASRIEFHCRAFPKELEKNIRLEIEKNG